jgi:DNA-binding response OmpR family regulator
MNEPCVLIVEADILVRNPLAEYLRQCGYRVLEAVDAAEARQVLSGGTAQVNIVLADANVADGAGFALAGWIRGNHPAVDVILAGSVARAAEKAGELCQDGPALAKPYDHQLLLAEIRRLLAARQRNDPGGNEPEGNDRGG